MKKPWERHEAWLIMQLGGKPMKSSGNQFNGPMDGRHDRYTDAWAWAWDGKVTEGKSIGVTRSMIAKAVEQAGGERPLLALRFEGEPDGDWFAIRADDFLELQEAATAAVEKGVWP